MKKFFDKNLISTNLIVALLCIVVVVAPLIVDYKNLPKGYEINKVYFINAISGLMLLVFSLSGLTNIISKRKLPSIAKNDTIVFFLFVLSFCISSVLSPFPEIAYFGNTFRSQGFYTHLLLLTTGFVLYKTLRKKHLKYVFFAFITSGFIQAIIGINQFIQLNTNDPERLSAGIWINGTFGQANWFAGRLLLVILICCFVFLKVNLRNKVAKVVLKFGTLVTLVLSISTVVFAYSRWGLVTLAIFTPLFFILQYPKIKVKNFFFILIALGILFTNVYVVFINQVFDLHSQIPREVINVFKSDNFNPMKVGFGYGFDTLGKVFQSKDIFKGVLIDRAHNFYFDLIIQGGLFLFGLLMFVLYKAGRQLGKIDDKYFQFLFLLTLMWLFRSTIHESGIVNLLDFVILLAITLQLSRKKATQN